MTSVVETLEQALGFHHRGELDRADEHYRAILRIDPGHADALHLLGVSLHQRNDHTAAVEHISRAIETDRSVALYHSNLGAAYRDLGRLDDAVECFGRAISLEPEFAGAHYNLGISFELEGHFDKAIDRYNDALRIDPGLLPAYNNLGRAHSRLGDHANAIHCFQQALEIDPSFVDARYNLGNAYASAGQLDNAIGAFREVIRESPGRAEPYNNLGTVLKERKQFDEAGVCFERALELDLDYADAHNNLGTVLQHRCQFEQAVAHYERAIAIDSQLTGAHINLANVHIDLGQPDLAATGYREALKCDADSAEARFNLALAELRQGHYAEGWDEYDSRWQRQVRPRNFARPDWNGESLAGKSIFMYAEQGIGDEVMFASCLDEVISMAEHCSIECDARLVPLFERSFSAARIIARPADRTLDETNDSDADLSNVDVQAAMGSLPKHLRRSDDDFPRQERYLIADADRIEMWRERYAQLGAGLKVGISWRGGDKPAVRRARSTSLERWSPVFSLPGVDFINLQYGKTTAELEALTQQGDYRIHDWDDVDRWSNLEDLAAQISALDLVISVDNSTVHFAGALGVPVWTLLHFASDWRWLLDRDDSVWYPSMRLFRQPEYGDWDSVFERVAQALRIRGAGVSPRSETSSGLAELMQRKPEHSPFRELSDDDRIEPEWTLDAAQQSPERPRRDGASSSADEPNQVVDDLLGTGNQHVAQNEFDQAARCYQEIIKAKPDSPEAHFNLANVFCAQGRTEQAKAGYERAIECRTDYLAAWLNLGNLHLTENDLDAASHCFDEVIRIDPTCAAAVHTNIGIFRYERNEWDAAESEFRKAIGKNAHYAEAYFNLGNVLAKQNRRKDAVESYYCALHVQPEHVEALNNLGNVLKELDRHDEARACFDEVLRRDPAHPGALINLGVLLHDGDQLEEAVDCYERALDGKPKSAEALTNLGMARLHQRELGMALDCFERALKSVPGHTESRFYRSIALLTAGEFSEGWAEYESRFDRDDLTYRNFTLPAWDGSRLGQRKLLVWAEQGVGDEIMFSSCLPELLAEEAAVMIECDPRLVSLFSRSFSGATVVARGDDNEHAMRECDCHIPLGSLPRYLRSDAAAFPHNEGFLTADADKTSGWRDRLASLGSGLKVGISWRGGRHREDQRRRSIAPELWKNVLQTDGAQFIDVQYGDTAADIKRFEESSGRTVHRFDAPDPLDDLDDFAARIAALDLVISIDNATVHFAGGLGTPVWTLLPLASDWRWFDGRSDSPWYPSMTLFRQETRGDWARVLSRVADSLVHVDPSQRDAHSH